MPAVKPLSLIRRHSTKEELEERESAELSLVPTTQISAKPPALLQKHKVARETWTRLVGLYFETEHTLITAFDQDALVKYCLLEEECVWLESMRTAVYKQAVSLQTKLGKMKITATTEAEKIKLYYSLLEQYNALIARVQGLDARLDGKRKLSHSLSQSMYLTPRSRAGVNPTAKPPEEKDEFGKKFD